jgi:hypothetical protein
MVLHCGETFNNRLSKWQAIKGIWSANVLNI